MGGLEHTRSGVGDSASADKETEVEEEMRDFLSLSVLARTRLHTENLNPKLIPDILCASGVIKYPECDSATITKIASRASLPNSKFVYRVGDRDFDPHNNTWYASSRVGKYEPLPDYTDSHGLQFEKFLLQPLTGKISLVNPLMDEVRRYCIRNPIPKYLFRGSIHDGDNHLGAAPGVPYWVSIPHGGEIVVKSPDPNLIKKSRMWFRMGLTWLGKPIFEKS